MEKIKNILIILYSIGILYFFLIAEKSNPLSRGSIYIGKSSPCESGILDMYICNFYGIISFIKAIFWPITLLMN